MKQKPSSKYFSFATIAVFVLLFSAGFFCLSPAIGAAEKKSTNSHYIDHEAIAKILPETDANAIAGKYDFSAELLKTSPDGNLFVFTSNAGLATKKIIKILQKDPAIISVQPNYQYKPLGRIPNDRYFSSQWGLADTATYAGGVAALSAWDLETPTKNKVPVAVLDTGVSYSQPDLKGVLTAGRAKGRNFLSPKKKPTDTEGHGTFISGIIAAKTNNKKGIAGSSFFGNLKIMPLKFDFTTSGAISALNYAKARHIPVVNASWGGYGEDGNDPLLADAIAAYPGTFVTAAGNGDAYGTGIDHDGGNPDLKMYPCDFDPANIICVAASDKAGALTEYSDYGATSVDVAAPGGTDSDPIFGLDMKKNKYTTGEGSSFSAAFVSAEAGLILAKKPHLSPAQVIEIIKNSVDAEPSFTGKVSSGGKINFQKALQLAASY